MLATWNADTGTPLGNTNIRVSQRREERSLFGMARRGEGAWSDGAYALECGAPATKANHCSPCVGDPQSKTCESACDWLELDTLAVSFPESRRRGATWFARARCACYYRAYDRFKCWVIFGSESPGAAIRSRRWIAVRRLRCSIPVEVPEAAGRRFPRGAISSGQQRRTDATDAREQLRLVKLTGTGLVNVPPRLSS